MKCNKCGNESVYHSTLIINGVSQSISLCRECAIKEGVFSDYSTVFDDMFSSFQDLLSFEAVKNVSCPVCKTTLKEFKLVGKLGCPNCYEAFRDEISKIIKRISPYEKHSQDTIKIKAKTVKLSKTEKIEALRNEMKQCVAEERYEDAAKIKKQILKLENADE